MISVGYSDGSIKYVFDDICKANRFLEKYNKRVKVVDTQLSEYEVVILKIKSDWVGTFSENLHEPKILKVLKRIERLRIFEETKDLILQTKFSEYEDYLKLKQKDNRELKIISTNIELNPEE